MLRLIWDIALHHLSGRRRQTLTTVTGVAVSTMVLITTISLTRGLLDSFVDTIVDVAPHMTLKGEPVTPPAVDLVTDVGGGVRGFVEENVRKEEREEVRAYRRILEMLQQEPFGSEVTAVSPYVQTQVMVINGNRNQPLVFKGVDVDREDRISGLASKLVAGSLEAFRKTPGALLVGRSVAEDLELDVNDEVTVVPASGPSRQSTVAGVFFTGVNAVDNTVFVTLKFGRILEQLSADKVSGIAFQVRDPQATDRPAASIERMTGYRCETWQEQNANILSLFTRIGYIVMSLVGFVGIVSGFGVANILVTTVFEKSRDIAIMKSFGFSAPVLVSLFILEGFLVGLAGALAGGILSVGSIAFLGSLPVETSQGPLTKTGFSMSWNPLYFLMVIVATSMISTIAAMFPALKAARMEPVSVLRDSSL
ncbi:ABC transporter permease [Prosthecochloris sp. N3]|uniref:ABC transporter permease n=1 Tax=Prosthecochloris ethylica TaxID=2743976 RepID=A0ABR9XRY2_9CHLB|nr:MULTISPECIES: FtsX-like permease family protein [Prosthecochloris]MEC9487148.1 FtsX-like permease family protein [Prosthecochloris sp.]MBF0586842.1 ABC transporter permease [Prosthecochloris ethylica]MBF0636810.1 ABC transporter permease [Prosthecochloris ethylica]NUK48026.1 ABC transporter permease [Prosthecochloris ethylica]RNA64317.1 ABC transporter permease [Prosthecochloris sp. ZM_2]